MAAAGGDSAPADPQAAIAQPPCERRWPEGSDRGLGQGPQVVWQRQAVPPLSVQGRSRARSCSPCRRRRCADSPVHPACQEKAWPAGSLRGQHLVLTPVGPESSGHHRSSGGSNRGLSALISSSESHAPASHPRTLLQPQASVPPPLLRAGDPSAPELQALTARSWASPGPLESARRGFKSHLCHAPPL